MPKISLPDQLNIPLEQVKALLESVKDYAPTSGMLITTAGNGLPSNVIDAEGNIIDIDPPFYSTHDILNYHGKHYVMLKPSIYCANQDNDTNSASHLDRGTREVVLLVDEKGRLFVAKIITVPAVIKERILRAATQEIKLAHDFSGAPHAECITREMLDGRTQIYLVQLYKGISLQKILDENINFFTCDQKIDIAMKILKIVRSLHNAGYLIKDLQLQNFCIYFNKKTGFYNVTLIDFGKAVKFDAKTGEEILPTSSVSENPESQAQTTPTFRIVPTGFQAYSVYTDIRTILNHMLYFIPLCPNKQERQLCEILSTVVASEHHDSATTDIQHITGSIIKNLKDLYFDFLQIKNAINEIIEQYKKHCRFSLFFAGRQGIIGIRRVNTLQQNCENATEIPHKNYYF